MHRKTKHQKTAVNERSAAKNEKRELTLHEERERRTVMLKMFYVTL